MADKGAGNAPKPKRPPPKEPTPFERFEALARRIVTAGKPHKPSR